MIKVPSILSEPGPPVKCFRAFPQTMTFLGRVLAASESCDLSSFPDAGSVSGWASPHIQTLVSLGVVGGSNGYARRRRQCCTPQ